MKTELLHSYSSTSLSGLSRSQSQISFTLDGGGHSTSQTGLVDKEGSGDGNSGIIGCCKQWSNNTFRKKILYKKVPVLRWIQEYNLKKLIADFIAGLTVGLTILPQGLAYATLAELPPQYGLYSGFVGCFVYIVFGSTKDITIGPTATMAIITLSYTNGKPPEYAVLLCFITGIITLAMGLLQLGFVVNFISTPVMSGFTSAVAVTIISTQLKALFGLSFDAIGFIDVVKETVTKLPELKYWDTGLSVVCCIVLLFLQRIPLIFKCVTKNKPVLNKILFLIATSRNAIVIIVCTIIFSFTEHPPTVKIIGDIVPGLPSWSLPPFSFSGNTTGEIVEYTFSNLISSSTTILVVMPLLAIMEHITIAKALAGTTQVDASQEMVNIGLTNLIGSFCSSMPVTGSFSRTTVNYASGVQTPMGGLVTGILVILSLQFLTPYFFYIPNAALASVIVCAVIFTIDIAIIRPMWVSKKMDILPWGITFLVSLLVSLEVGILCGFLISLVFLLYYSARPGVRVKRGETSTGIEFILVDLDRSLVFPSVEYTRYVLMKAGTNWAKDRLPVVLDCQHIQFADYTAAQGVKDIFTMFNTKNQELVLWKLKASVVRIVTGVMTCSGTPFKYCNTEAELEAILEERRADLEKDGDVKITFTLPDEETDDNDEDEKSGTESDNKHMGDIDEASSL